MPWCCWEELLQVTNIPNQQCASIKGDNPEFLAPLSQLEAVL
jgi:hypothetical protein